MHEQAAVASGYYSAAYFNRGRAILENEGMRDTVLMQLFQKQDAVICGLTEAAEIIRECSAPGADLEIMSLNDGDRVEPWETIMTIRGPLVDFMHLESVYLGVIRDSTTVATNMARLVEAANGKDVLYLADRFNGFENQERQGYAASMGGASGLCTDAMCMYTGKSAMGTMAHAYIAAFGGDLVAASQAFASNFPGVPLVALVDFHNDCVGDSLAVCRALGSAVTAVRLDTSEKMVDKSLQDEPLEWLNGLNGVCPDLVWNVRNALDAEGFNDVKIVVSGGFNELKIHNFEAADVPVDVYGVGSSVLKGGSDITADVVWPVGKEGRVYRPNQRLHLV